MKNRITYEGSPCEGYMAFNWDVYGETSVLAGQERKSFLGGFASEDELLAEYPGAEASQEKAFNYFDHLPDEE